MGLLSGITDLFFGDDGQQQIQQASEEQLALQERALDYLIESGQIPMEARDDAIQALQGFYSGDRLAQERLLESVQSSPFYEQMIASGQEGVLDRAGAMGLSRSGNTAQDLSRSNQAVLQGLLSQRLGGLSGLAGLPSNAANVANQFNLMGQTTGQAGIAQANLQQQQQGQLLGLVKSGITAAMGGM